MRNYLLIIWIFLMFLNVSAKTDVGYVSNAVITVDINAKNDFCFNGVFDVSKYSMCANVMFPFDGSLKIGSTQALWGIYRCRNYLVIGIETPAGGELIASQQLRDGKIWTDDSYEVYLTDKFGEKGFHFIFNSKSGIYDAKLHNGSHNVKWDAEGIEVKHCFKDGKWSAEIKLPLTALGELADRSVWKLGIYRSAQGKRANEGIGQNRNDSYYDLAGFVELHWQAGIVKYGYMLDLESMVKGVLAGELILSSGRNSAIEWEFGVAPLDFAINDAYNQSRESLKKSGIIPPAAGTNKTSFYKIKCGSLPNAGTIRMTLRQDGKTIFERFLPYDRQKFTQFKLTNVWAGANHEYLYANVNTIAKGSYELSLIASNGKTVVKKDGSISGTKTLKLPLAGVKSGKYILLARLFAPNGQELQRDSGPFTVIATPPEWLGNSLGITNGKVPLPWTPIKITPENNVKIWGRIYSLNAGGLPSAMNGPSGLAATNCRFEAGDENFAPKSFKWLKRAGDESCFEAVFKLSNSTIHLKGTIEFDGLLWLNCRIIPGRGEKLPDIDFCFDVPEANGTLVYSGEHMAANSGFLPAEKSWSKDMLNFVPMFWIGNGHGGTGFFADDLRGWNLTDYRKTVEISAVSNGKRTVAVHLLSQKMNTVDKDYKLEFALQVTPVKPLPKGWRNFQVNGGIKQNLHFYALGITKYFNVPMPVVKTAKKSLANWRKKGIKAPVYLAFSGISPFTADYCWFSEEWRVVPQQRPRYHNPDFMTHTFICPRGKGYTDYYLYKLNQMIDAVDADGLYFDYAQPTLYRCANPIHGCEWKDNHGVKHSSIRLKASREWAKRIYVLFKQKRPDGLIVHHNSGGLLIPFHGFSDITWNGEQTTANLLAAELCYSKFLNMDKYRIEQRHEPWGVIICFLPQYLRAVQLYNPDYFGNYKKIGWDGLWKTFDNNPKMIKDTWFLAGIALLNDSMFSGDWGMWHRLKDLTGIQKKLSWDSSVKFYAYFDPENPFKKLSPSNSKVYVSAYSAPGGYLLVVFNDNNQKQNVKITLPDNIKKCYDAVSNRQLIPVNGTLCLEIPDKNPRLVLVTVQEKSQIAQ